MVRVRKMSDTGERHTESHGLEWLEWRLTASRKPPLSVTQQGTGDEREPAQVDGAVLTTVPSDGAMYTVRR